MKMNCKGSSDLSTCSQSDDARHSIFKTMRWRLLLSHSCGILADTLTVVLAIYFCGVKQLISVGNNSMDEEALDYISF